MRRGSGSGRMGRESGTGFCIQTAFLHMRPVVGSLSVFCWAWVRGCLWALVVSAHHSGSAHSISAHFVSAHSVFGMGGYDMDEYGMGGSGMGGYGMGGSGMMGGYNQSP